MTMPFDRYTNEAKRLYAVLDRRLGEAPYLAGEDYSIADIATFPWLRCHERQGIDLGDCPSVKGIVTLVGGGRKGPHRRPFRLPPSHFPMH